MPTFNCKQCKKPFNARQADRNRGWARFCSKSCKAKKQSQSISHNKYRYDDLEDVGHPLAEGYFGHGQN